MKFGEDMKRIKNVRIKDVAEKAEVSTATVSHVINGNKYVSEKIKNKVNTVLRELNYQPNSAARSLRSTKTNTIGLIIPINSEDTSKSFFMSIAEGIEEKLKSKGYNLILSNSKEDSEQELNLIKMFKTKVDGLILAPTNENFKAINETIDHNFQTVMIDRLPVGYKGDYVLVDNFQGTYEGINELIKSGFKKIGFLSSGLGVNTSSDKFEVNKERSNNRMYINPNNERFQAYKVALSDNKLNFNPNYVLFGESSFQSGYDLAKQLISKGVDAIFIANNIMAMGSVKFIQEQKLIIPDGIGMIGYDNYDWTEIISPPLSAIKQPAFEIGVQASELMLNRIQNPTAGFQHIKLKTENLKRSSY
ncbi:LacI family DNA-binding transcriptional regulator [Amphibacillus jilinensis]|uniref:LacI family DNA-binding transcriptional regulator n=1 Tax=Amphibacillus jilinensis TaxID=1216008 RepID=UPI00036245E8|nr:LacI family DNA-binding transcriptional regulator [Amphibacillus jilinensis]